MNRALWLSCSHSTSRGAALSHMPSDLIQSLDVRTSYDNVTSVHHAYNAKQDTDIVRLLKSQSLMKFTHS